MGPLTCSSLFLISLLGFGLCLTPDVDEKTLRDAWTIAERSLEREQDGSSLNKERLEAPAQCPFSIRGVRQAKETRQEVLDVWKDAERFARAVDYVCDTQNVTRPFAERLLTERAAPRTGLDVNVLCRTRSFSCNANFKYRTTEGFCNNLGNTDFGMAVVKLARLLPANYGDGTNSFRRARNGQELPLARLVSTRVVRDVSSPHNSGTHMLMFFGQFLNHDITSTPHRTDLDKCCGQHRGNPDCAVINIPNDDPQFGAQRIGCMEFARSHRACGNGPREQINQNTAFVDGSQIYGSTDSEMRPLRTMRGGLLVSSGNGQLPPVNANDQTCTPTPGSNSRCFMAGDNRANENPGLAAMHVVFLREHNRIAQALASINRNLDDETLFQETRRIVVAQLQNIVYSEYLPQLLGQRVMDEFRIILPTNAGFTRYDASIVPNIINSFSTAAYRFGHSIIQGQMNLARGSINLADNFNNPTSIHQNGIDGIVFGSTRQPSQSMDNYVTPAVTRQLFREGNNQNGMDLASLNIQRGRDHGLPSYNEFRKKCSVKAAATFNEMGTFFVDRRAADEMANIYSSVEDVDLWPAGISESPRDGAMLGPVFSCIMGTQFNRLMWGDRYFFTHQGQAGSFSADQLGQLRRRTLASVICDNAPNVGQLQPNVFVLPRSGNNPINCAAQPKLNLAIFNPRPISG